LRVGLRLGLMGWVEQVCGGSAHHVWAMALHRGGGERRGPVIGAAPVRPGVHGAVGTGAGVAGFWRVCGQGGGIVGDLGSVGPSVIDQRTDG
jgi:hypothetical protein